MSSEENTVTVRRLFDEAFNMRNTTFILEGFHKTGKQLVRLEPDTLAESLAEYFGIDQDRIALALHYRHVI